MDRRALPWIIFLYSLFCFWIRKREKETWLPYSYFPLWNRRMKNERTVYTTRGYFPFILFTSCKRKNENGYNGSYFYFSFLVWGLVKKKRMLSYPFSIFYFKIEKREDGIYTDLSNQHASYLFIYTLRATIGDLLMGGGGGGGGGLVLWIYCKYLKLTKDPILLTDINFESNMDKSLEQLLYRGSDYSPMPVWLNGRWI